MNERLEHLHNSLAWHNEQIADTVHHLIELGREQAIIQQMIRLEIDQSVEDQQSQTPQQAVGELVRLDLIH